MLNAWASHTSAANFSDPLTWNPKRWIASYPLYSTNTSLPDVLTTEEVKHPTSGSGFFAWGSGPRICPGMKFSQVEFCGALSTILKKVRVDVVYEEGGQVQVARQKMMGILRDSCADPLLLHVRRPEKLELKIIGR
jgi:cytochrome P450